MQRLVVRDGVWLATSARDGDDVDDGKAAVGAGGNVAVGTEETE